MPFGGRSPSIEMLMEILHIISDNNNKDANTFTEQIKIFLGKQWWIDLSTPNKLSVIFNFKYVMLRKYL